MTKSIEKYITSLKIKIDIYFYLCKQYKNLSHGIIDAIIDFLIQNKEGLNAKGVLILLEKAKPNEKIQAILKNLYKFIIKENELFSEEKDLESFQLLEGINEGGLFGNHDLKKTYYYYKTFENKEKLFHKIKKGEINYNIFEKCYSTKANQEIFEKKLRILLFNNSQYFGECINNLKKMFDNISKIIEYINKLIQLLKEFFPNIHKNNIIKIEKFRDLIINGMMSEIKKPEVQNNLEEIYNILPKNIFEKMNKLRKSLLFKQLYEEKKNNNIELKDNEIFEKVENDFNKLKILFKNDNWSQKIPDSILSKLLMDLKIKKKIL